MDALERTARQAWTTENTAARPKTSRTHNDCLRSCAYCVKCPFNSTPTKVTFLMPLRLIPNTRLRPTEYQPSHRISRIPMRWSMGTQQHLTTVKTHFLALPHSSCILDMHLHNDGQPVDQADPRHGKHRTYLC